MAVCSWKSFSSNWWFQNKWHVSSCLRLGFCEKNFLNSLICIRATAKKMRGIFKRSIGKRSLHAMTLQRIENTALRSVLVHKRTYSDPWLINAVVFKGSERIEKDFFTQNSNLIRWNCSLHFSVWPFPIRKTLWYWLRLRWTIQVANIAKDVFSSD